MLPDGSHPFENDGCGGYFFAEVYDQELQINVGFLGGGGCTIA